ncbi:hypothetical protein [Zavarzinia aquatilis]|uniref:RcnB family protein n=1 Tax=Zavarzinia aquatilis TaxID=2211142 RepID=A0A317E7T9_9PROT|nr:hypothetical protein [Zavarzinia aquatilis]PWR22721.1 hypothetical protein DKG74_12395 [Zavarzinia aquatilis]
MTLAVLFTGLGLALTGAAEGKNNGNGRGNGNGNGHGGGDVPVEESLAPAIASILFPTGDRQVISNYFLRNNGYLADLPPGIRKQLVTRGRLPPGIAKKVLPAGLSGQLSPLPAGYDRMIVGPDVLLVQIATGLIVDIIRDVVR